MLPPVAPTKVFSFPVKFQWSDLDRNGLVYHLHYMRLFEQARTSWLLAQGYKITALEDAGTAMIVRSSSFSLSHPAKLDEQYLVTVEVGLIKPGVVQMRHELRAAADGTNLASASVQLACVDVATFRTLPFPLDLLAVFEQSKTPGSTF
jgi:acyl-CoA thioester hydrolase